MFGVRDNLVVVVWDFVGVGFVVVAKDGYTMTTMSSDI